MRNLPLKHKLIVSGIAAVVIPFFIAGLLIYIQLSNHLLEMSREKSVHMARDISKTIEKALDQVTTMASSIAADPDMVKAVKTGYYAEAQKELEAIYSRIGKKYFTMFMLDKFGIVKADAIFTRQIGLDLSDRKYFLDGKQGKTSLAGPYFARGKATAGEPIIVVSAPIHEKDAFYGIVAMPFNKDFLTKILLETKVGKTGYAYLINAEGLMLVHPREEFNMKLHLLDEPHTQEIKKAIQGKKLEKTANYKFEGFNKIAGLSRVKTTDWIVVFTQNKKEILAPVNKILLVIFICASIFLFITIFAIIFSSSKISDPIHQVLEMMRQLTRHSTEIIIQIGLDKKILYANPAFEKVTGINPDKIIGTEPDLTNLGGVSQQAIWELLESGKIWSGRVQLKDNKPEPVTLNVMLLQIRDHRGAIQGYLEIGQDITAELMYEKRLRQAQKLEAIGTLAGGIAHDFNNILSGIFGFAELSLLNKKNCEQNENYIRQIISASERATDLVNQILTFSRRTETELRPLWVKPVLKEALNLLRASIPSSIQIQTAFATDSRIMAEPTQIHQIIMNLFTNAVHAIGQKPGTIQLNLEDFWVDEQFMKTHPNIQGGKHIIIRISDTGGGIKKEVMDHIFEPFFTTKSQGKGTGLGLSVVHGIVKKLGGIITAYSEMEKGTTFNILIPVVEPSDSDMDQDHAVVQGGTERIAFVDDEAAITTTMRHILENLGYTVTTYTDSMHALMAIKARPQDFDVIVTDHSMPQITGLEIARELKETGISIPIILISGYFEKHMEEEARNSGISRLIVKPVNTYKLTDAIHHVLREKRA